MKKNKQIDKMSDHQYVDGMINQIYPSMWALEKKIKRRQNIILVIKLFIVFAISLYLFSRLFVAYAQVQEKKKYMTVARLRQSLFLQNQQRHPTGSYCVNCYNK